MSFDLNNIIFMTRSLFAMASTCVNITCSMDESNTQFYEITNSICENILDLIGRFAMRELYSLADLTQQPESRSN